MTRRIITLIVTGIIFILIVLALFAVINTGAGLWLGQSTYGTSDYPNLSATIDTVRGGFSIILIMIAAFYGGELVWRERDRKLNEIQKA